MVNIDMDDSFKMGHVEEDLAKILSKFLPDEIAFLVSFEGHLVQQHCKIDPKRLVLGWDVPHGNRVSWLAEIDYDSFRLVGQLECSPYLLGLYLES